MDATRGASVLLAAILGATGLACAAQAMSEPGARLAQPPQTSGGIPYLSGGVGVEERDQIREKANDYNLWIWLARTGSGYFLADVKVNIEDARGRPVLDTVTNGPWLLARVPPGRYTIRTDQSEAPTTVTVGAVGHTQTVLRFPGPEGS
jgi:hypothetical protein